VREGQRLGVAEENPETVKKEKTRNTNGFIQGGLKNATNG